MREMAENKLAEHKKYMKLCDKSFEEGDKAKAQEYLMLAARAIREGSEFINKAIDEDLLELQKQINEKEAMG